VEAVSEDPVGESAVLDYAPEAEATADPLIDLFGDTVRVPEDEMQELPEDGPESGFFSLL